MQKSLVLAAALFGLTSPSSAQGSRIVDEGSFTISINGRTAGRENFRISTTTAGDVAEYHARADVTYGDRRVSPELRTASNGAVMKYDVTTRGGASADSWSGEVGRGRLAVRIASGRGTSAREYIVPSGTLVLDDEVMHHNWFLVHRARSGGMPVVVPRRSNVQATANMTTVGEESLQIGNHGVPATHIRATIGDEVRDIWVDKSGRLLKVALPARGLVALRDDPPPA